MYVYITYGIQVFPRWGLDMGIKKRGGRLMGSFFLAAWERNGLAA